jgi:hypothetical protein
MNLSDITLSYHSTFKYSLYQDYQNLNSLFKNINKNELNLLKNKFDIIINILLKNKLYCEYYLYRTFITKTINKLEYIQKNKLSQEGIYIISNEIYINYLELDTLLKNNILKKLKIYDNNKKLNYILNKI